MAGVAAGGTSRMRLVQAVRLPRQGLMLHSMTSSPAASSEYIIAI
jgi:hypothetical protein